MSQIHDSQTDVTQEPDGGAGDAPVEPSPVAEYHRQREAELMARFRRKTAWIYTIVGAVILFFNRQALMSGPLASEELVLLAVILVVFPLSWRIGVMRFRKRLQRNF